MADIWGTITEGTSAEVKFTIKDQDGVGFQPTTLTFTLYDSRTEAVLNSRNAVSLTPVSDYVTSAGLLRFNMTAADAVFRDSGRRVERHIAKFVITWSSGTKVAKFECPFNLVRDTEPA